MNRRRPEATVNYGGVLRRHRAYRVDHGYSLLLSVLYTLVAPKVYKSEVILEATRINGDFMNAKEVDPTSSATTNDQFVETQTKLLRSPPVVRRTAVAMGPKVPAAIAAKQGLFGNIRGWIADALQPLQRAMKLWCSICLGTPRSWRMELRIW